MFEDYVLWITGEILAILAKIIDMVVERTLPSW